MYRYIYILKSMKMSSPAKDFDRLGDTSLIDLDTA
jgi:hypothetical protein